MLSIKKRQEYLKYLGFYKGAVDGISGAKTKQAIKELQDKYFTRKSDRDGIYGKNTDILLVNAYRVKKYTKNFDLKEFKCGCGGKYCTGYPVYLSINLLKDLQTMRNIYGAIRITSPLRCASHNKAVGGVSSSYHTKGKALDLYNSNFSKSFTTRKNAIEKWLTLPDANMGYENGYMHYKGKTPTGYNAPNMGNVIHVQVN
jgi:hypothetical protein